MLRCVVVQFRVLPQRLMFRRAATYVDVHWNLPFGTNGVLTGYAIFYQTSELNIVKITKQTQMNIITEIDM